jgi:diaminohydroxyphosphoribosylaminopyrimidine deaminase / 5-amino-6-(5-phosphoribosylamino)uracil reductase
VLTLGTGTGAGVAPSDVAFMRRALELAARGLGLAPPNPMVGALVAADGKVVGEGWHEGPGTAHAEIGALRAAGDRARGATLYVTLEPCSHQGRTPPCAPVVAGSGISRVVVGSLDPNPIVDGRGLAYLRAQGLEVAEGVCGDEARELVAGFSKHVLTGLPFVTLKLAMSLDGKVAARDGSSRWITGEAARRDAHRLRAAAGAIVVGVGTVTADDPALTVRLQGYRGRQPMRVVLDARGRTPADAVVLRNDAPTLVVTTASAPLERRIAWESAGAEVLVEAEADGSSRLDLARVLELLGKRDVQDVLIEGGPTVAWSALEAGLVDRMVVYLAPKLIGGVEAPSALGGSGIASIADAFPLSIVRVERLGEDLKVVADVHRDR